MKPFSHRCGEGLDRDAEGQSAGRHHWGRHHRGFCRHERGEGRDRVESTGNSVLDARRREVLEKIEAERAKLREEAKAFAEFAARERRDADQALFDRFMAERAKGAGETPVTEA
ncbi:DUF2852 domain-containing protein [Aestuariivirga sp.]|uniref:DUF2852 domain-containing protein n=1 Tax=Aestuariivirga sp. TaxID=2650926 RepID=UPI0039E46802